MVQEKDGSFYREPGMHNEAQVVGLKETTDAVHAKGGRIFSLQIWHGGHTTHPLNSDGEQPVSNIAVKVGHTVQAEFSKDGQKHDYSVPHALTDDETRAKIWRRASQSAPSGP